MPELPSEDWAHMRFYPAVCSHAVEVFIIISL